MEIFTSNLQSSEMFEILSISFYKYRFEVKTISLTEKKLPNFIVTEIFMNSLELMKSIISIEEIKIY